MNEKNILQRYELAKEVYKEVGIDTEQAIEKIDAIPISMHAWQGDDLLGFEGADSLSGGIQATGNYPGRARTADELRGDIEAALRCVPGTMKVSIHALHAEKGSRKVDRDAYDASLFQNWIDWAKENRLGLDFNPTFFSHPMMDGNFSVTSLDEKKRRFWIEHGKRCREISAEIGRQLGTPCIDNFWFPDGYKDIPADTLVLRQSMTQALDEIFAEKIDSKYTIDSLESKLFGIGVESYTVASHEFSLLYALTRNILYTLDAGHFHPTESIAAKLSAILNFAPEAMLHVSRGVRWDSDHVVIWNDELQAIADEIVHNGYEKRIHIGLDFFDASINRIACWVIGVRDTRKALLKAALDPIAMLRKAEGCGDYTTRLAGIEEAKGLPIADVWDYYCLKKGIPVGFDWLRAVKEYEKDVTSKRES